MKLNFIFAIAITGLLAIQPALAKDKPGRSHSRDQSGDTPVLIDPALGSVGKSVSPQPPRPKEPWLNVQVGISDKVVISENERQIIHTYIDRYPVQDRSARKGKGLPPGLAKNKARGRDLPPGWEKKCIRGETMPQTVYAQAKPIPPDLIVKLPPPPAGTITVAIDGKVVRLVKATLEILDVFDVHVRL